VSCKRWLESVPPEQQPNEEQACEWTTFKWVAACAVDKAFVGKRLEKAGEGLDQCNLQRSLREVRRWPQSIPGVQGHEKICT
jgi:hypothetical protein